MMTGRLDPEVEGAKPAAATRAAVCGALDEAVRPGADRQHSSSGCYSPRTGVRGSAQRVHVLCVHCDRVV